MSVPVPNGPPEEHSGEPEPVPDSLLLRHPSGRPDYEWHEPLTVVWKSACGAKLRSRAREETSTTSHRETRPDEETTNPEEPDPRDPPGTGTENRKNKRKNHQVPTAKNNV